MANYKDKDRTDSTEWINANIKLGRTTPASAEEMTRFALRGASVAGPRSSYEYPGKGPGTYETDRSDLGKVGGQ